MIKETILLIAVFAGKSVLGEEDKILQEMIKISELNYCDNIELIADSAWEICSHDKDGFTWKHVQMCEVTNSLILYQNQHLMKEKLEKFCEDMNAAGKKYGFDCPGFRLPSKEDFDETGKIIPMI